MKKNKLILIAATVCCGLVVGGVCINPTTNLFKASTALDNLERSFDHSDASRIEFDGSNATLKDGSATYVFTGASASTSGFVNLADGGTLSKDQAKGLKSVKVTFTGNLTLKTGFNAEELCFSYSLTSGEAETIRGNYFKIVATGAVEISKLELSYNCLNEEAESHNLEANYTYDDEYHWKNCTDSHCSHQEKTRHAYKAYGFNKTYTDKPQSFDTEFECNYCEQPKITNTFVRKDIDGKIALASGYGGGETYTNLGGSSGSYTTDAGLAGYTKIGDQIASVYQFNKRVSPITDGTGKKSSFRLMSGYDITSGAHQYNFTFKNLGDKTLTFDVYNRSGGSDTSDLVNPLNVVIKPNEVINAKYIYNGSSNTNILTYFRFADDNYIGQKLAIDLHLLNTVEKVEVTMSNALFTGDVATKEYEYGSHMSTSDFATSDVAGITDGNIVKTLEDYTITDDVTLSALFKPVYVTSGTGEVKVSYGHTGEGVYPYTGTSASRDGFSYIDSDNKYAQVLKVTTTAAATTSDGTGLNTHFRFFNDYAQSSAYPNNLFYTIKNLSSQTLSFDIVQRNGGQDKSSAEFHEVRDLLPGEVRHVNFTYVPNGSNDNTMTHFKFIEACTNARIAVHLSAANGYKLTLTKGAAFNEGTATSGYFKNGTVLTLKAPDVTNYVLKGFGDVDNGIYTSGTSYTTGNKATTLAPVYDTENYVTTLTTSWAKIDLQEGNKYHPSNGYAGSFTAGSRPALSDTFFENADGIMEKATRYKFTSAVVAGSQYLIMNTLTAQGTATGRYSFHNYGDETITINLYSTGTSSAPHTTAVASNVVIAPGATVTVEKTHANFANNNSMLCVEYVNALSSLNLAMTKWAHK